MEEISSFADRGQSMTQAHIALAERRVRRMFPLPILLVLSAFGLRWVNLGTNLGEVLKKPGPKFVVLLLLGLLGSAQAEDLRVMKTGLGKGWIDGSSISCGITATNAATDTDTFGTSCNATSTTSITLTAHTLPGSTFAGWGGDCAGTANTCTVTMNAMRSVRARFTLNIPVPPLTTLTPTGISAYLTGNSSVNTAAEFVAALPQEFRENWILMTRSESLQTGTSKFPRILLISQHGRTAFTLGLAEFHTSYPGAHRNAI